MKCCEVLSMQLPQLAFAVFGRNLNHSRFVDDSSCPVALLNNTDDPRLVALLLLNVFAERSCLLSWQCNQQTTCISYNQHNTIEEWPDRSLPSVDRLQLVHTKMLHRNQQIKLELSSD